MQHVYATRPQHCDLAFFLNAQHHLSTQDVGQDGMQMHKECQGTDQGRGPSMRTVSCEGHPHGCLGQGQLELSQQCPQASSSAANGLSTLNMLSRVSDCAGSGTRRRACWACPAVFEAAAP